MLLLLLLFFVVVVVAAAVVVVVVVVVVCLLLGVGCCCCASRSRAHSLSNPCLSHVYSMCGVLTQRRRIDWMGGREREESE